MFAKTIVNGPDTCDVYRHLKRHSSLYDKNTKTYKDLPWNFCKFLVDMNGEVVKYYTNKVKPLELVPDIEALLKKMKS